MSRYAVGGRYAAGGGGNGVLLLSTPTVPLTLREYFCCVSIAGTGIPDEAIREYTLSGVSGGTVLTPGKYDPDSTVPLTTVLLGPTFSGVPATNVFPHFPQDSAKVGSGSRMIFNPALAYFSAINGLALGADASAAGNDVYAIWDE